MRYFAAVHSGHPQKPLSSCTHLRAQLPSSPLYLGTGSLMLWIIRGTARRQPRRQPSSGFPHRVLVVLLVLVPGWFLRRRRIKRISIAEAAHTPDRDHALLIGGPAAIGAASVASPVVGTPRIINLRTRVGREAERSHKKRNNELNCFHHLHRTSPSDFSVGRCN